MDIDVIIPTSKKIIESSHSICFTIRSLIAQTIQPKNIIVTTNCYNSLTISVLKEKFGDFIKIIEYEPNVNNISYARNLGARLGNSEIILFIDDDVILGDNGILEKISCRLRYEDFYCGAHRLWAPTEWAQYFDLKDSINHIQRILQYSSFKPTSIDRFSGKRTFNDFSFIGNFGAIKRDIFNKVGGYDENYEGWTYQDTDLMMRLCLEGYSYLLMADDEISVYHLSHPVDKSKYRDINRGKFCKKQQEQRIKFHLNHFFGIFEPFERSCKLFTHTEG